MLSFDYDSKTWSVALLHGRLPAAAVANLLVGLAGNVLQMSLQLYTEGVWAS